MAALSKDEIEQIVAQQMPGYTVVQESLQAGSAPTIKGAPDAVTPPIGAPSGTSSDAIGSGEEYTMVLVQPVQQDALQTSNPGPKAIIISNTTKQIIGAQG